MLFEEYFISLNTLETETDYLEDGERVIGYEASHYEESYDSDDSEGPGSGASIHSDFRFIIGRLI